jgi:NADH:ubiquinone oxidoreductase subunit B-like Fe-S oxidoreductase
VVAVGDCGCSGGIFGESYASLGRVSNVIPVDVAIPGCPPAPAALLQGILAAVSVAAPAAEWDTESAAQLAAELRTEPTLGASAAGLPERTAEPAPDAPAGEPPTSGGDPP